jgi:N-acetylneuraminate synthase
MKQTIFDDLFVLEVANNHWGRLDRGLKIIADFADVVRRHGVRAAIKLQFRDVGSFIHRQHRDRNDVRYIKKIGDTELSWDELRQLVDAIRAAGMLAMATPFDEVSVDKCVEFDLEILKIASSDIRDRVLLEKIAATGRPTIASSGGASLADLDHLVEFFAERDIPFALNHCVSIYPSKDSELELNQIDFLKARYPDTVIGYSTHEMTDWTSSVVIAYAKGARTFERHVDIDFEGVPVSPYCTLPHQAEQWFQAFLKAREMCGAEGMARRTLPEKEIRYLDQLVRGVYAKRDLDPHHVLTEDDVYFAVPLVHGQISVREFTGGEILKSAIGKDQPVRVREIDSDYANDLVLQRLIDDRGVPRAPIVGPGELKRAGSH